MNLELKIDPDLERNRVAKKDSFDGVAYIFHFANDYGASVIKHSGSYGSSRDLWELGVIAFMDDEWHLTYDTPVTDDVLGYLDDEDVNKYLWMIKSLDIHGQLSCASCKHDRKMHERCINCDDYCGWERRDGKEESNNSRGAMET